MRAAVSGRFEHVRLHSPQRKNRQGRSLDQACKRTPAHALSISMGFCGQHRAEQGEVEPERRGASEFFRRMSGRGNPVK